MGAYTVWDAYAVLILLVPPLLLDHVSSIGRSVLLAPIALKRMDLVKAYWRNHRTGVVIIAILNPWPISWCSMP